MSIKREANGRRSVQVEVEVPGTPEEVWQAIATGPGIAAWFVPCEVEGGVGGTVTSHFGAGMDSVATITAWNPPHGFAADAQMGPGVPVMATEWQVEARDGGKCLVRVVQSLVAETDEWDNQLDGLENGWPAFFRILRLQLEHFPGQPSACFQLTAMPPAGGDSWTKLTTKLHLAGALKGERRNAGDGAPPLSGIVESIEEGAHAHVLLRLDLPAPGAVFAGSCPAGEVDFISVSFYLYGDSAAAMVARDEGAWTAWMAKLFPQA
ncbi:MAG: SRPBCC domain-containing protein [Candidatus Solibacter sp.]